MAFPGVLYAGGAYTVLYARRPGRKRGGLWPKGRITTPLCIVISGRDHDAFASLFPAFLDREVPVTMRPA